MIVPRRISSRRAAEILRGIFGRVKAEFAFRLWDGTQVMFGERALCTAVIHRQETFIRLVRDPSPLTLAEAYVEGVIDLEGDLFAAMTIADALEDIRLSTGDRMRILVALWRG